MNRLARHRHSRRRLCVRAPSSPRTSSTAVYDAHRRQGERPVWISVRTRQDALPMAGERAEGSALSGSPSPSKTTSMLRVCRRRARVRTSPICLSAPRPSSNVLEGAGAIVIGKTNLDQFATGLVGTRSPYGIPSEHFQRRVHQRRFELRLCGGGCERACLVRARHGYGRFGPHAGSLQQHRRPEADKGIDQCVAALFPPAGRRTRFRFSPSPSRTPRASSRLRRHMIPMTHLRADLRRGCPGAHAIRR